LFQGVARKTLGFSSINRTELVGDGRNRIAAKRGGIRVATPISPWVLSLCATTREKSWQEGRADKDE
jgi:hypothetical protein